MDLRVADVNTVVSQEVVAVQDLSGSQVDFIQVLTELLQNKPQTMADAVALYHKISTKLTQHLISELPALEQKAASLAMWAVEEVQSGKCKSWFCVPK